MVTAEEFVAGVESIADGDGEGSEPILGFTLRVGEGGPIDGLRDGGLCGAI